jgi:hypothetical protein
MSSILASKHIHLKKNTVVCPGDELYEGTKEQTEQTRMRQCSPAHKENAHTRKQPCCTGDGSYLVILNEHSTACL